MLRSVILSELISVNTIEISFLRIAATVTIVSAEESASWGEGQSSISLDTNKFKNPTSSWLKT